MAAGLCWRPVSREQHVCAEYLSCNDFGDYASGILWRPHDGYSTGLLYSDGAGASARTGTPNKPAASSRSELALSAGQSEAGNRYCTASSKDERISSQLSCDA